MRYSRFAGVGLMASVVTATTLAWPGSDGQQPAGNPGRQPAIVVPGDQIQDQNKMAEPVSFEARQAQFQASPVRRHADRTATAVNQSNSAFGIQHANR